MGLDFLPSQAVEMGSTGYVTGQILYGSGASIG
jgi:hypothetical protein